MWRYVNGEFVVAASKVLHDRMPSRDVRRRAHAFESAHRAQPRLEPAVVGFHDVVGILLHHMSRTRFVEQPRVDRCPIGRDLDRNGSEPHRAGEERTRRGAVSALREQDVDDLAVLIDRAVEVSPASGDLDVSLVNEPSIAGSVPRSASSSSTSR